MNQNPYNNFNGAYYQPPAQIQQNYIRQQQISAARSKEKTEIFTAGLALGAAILANLFVQVVGVSFLQATGKYDLFQNSFLYQHSINIILVEVFSLVLPFFIVSLLLKKRYITPIVPREKVKFMTAASWVAIGLAICMAANYATNGIIQLFKHFGYELTQPESLKPSTAFECVLLVFSTAVAPAICEEFAMRCASLGALRKHGKAFAVVAVSIVFGLLHGNVIQFVFAFCIGLILGYVTIVTDSIVPAMFIHGLNNGLSVVQDICKYAIGNKDLADYLVAGIILVIFVTAVLGFIYLLAKKQLLPPKDNAPQKPYKINFFVKLGLLMPGFAIPFIILISLTISTIKPI